MAPLAILSVPHYSSATAIEHLHSSIDSFVATGASSELPAIPTQSEGTTYSGTEYNDDLLMEHIKRIVDDDPITTSETIRVSISSADPSEASSTAEPAGSLVQEMLKDGEAVREAGVFVRLPENGSEAETLSKDDMLRRLESSETAPTYREPNAEELAWGKRLRWKEVTCAVVVAGGLGIVVVYLVGQLPCIKKRRQSRKSGPLLPSFRFSTDAELKID